MKFRSLVGLRKYSTEQKFLAHHKAKNTYFDHLFYLHDLVVNLGRQIKGKYSFFFLYEPNVTGSPKTHVNTRSKEDTPLS